MDLPRIEIDELPDGVAKKFKMIRSSKISEASILFEVASMDGVHHAVISGMKNEPYVTLTKMLAEVRMKQDFYLGKKDGVFVVKIVDPVSHEPKTSEPDPEKKLPWSISHEKPEEKKSDRLAFGVHDKKGNPLAGYDNPEKDEYQTVSNDDDKKKTDAAEVSERDIGEKSARLSEAASQAFDSNVIAGHTLACPHCKELIEIGIEIGRHRVAGTK